MTGPAPKPTALKRLQGNPGRRRLNANEPQPRQGRVYCPRWLSPEAKREWRRVSGELTRLRLLTVVDQTALAIYCETFAEWRHACRVLDQEGYTYVTDKGYVGQHPMVAVKHKAGTLIKAFLAEFGMTPASRSRISIATPEAPDPFAEYLAESRVTERLDDTN